MCILFIAVEQHPEYPLIICANRDEFHQRPTQPMHWWQNEKILAGKDLQVGGTWLGLSATGRFSALTNYRQPAKYEADRRSRGELVINALHDKNEKTLHTLKSDFNLYNGFNLIYGDLNKLYAFDSVNHTVKALGKGFHSVCNGALDDIWPKMLNGIEQLKQLTTQTTISIDNLFTLMSDRTTTDEELPNTGLSKTLETLLSSIFIASEDYGTRSTTLILQDRLNKVKVFEQSYNIAGECINTENFQFTN